jgi:hypothetical protein
MVDQPELLEDHADLTAQLGKFRPWRQRYIAAEQVNQTAGRPQRQIHQLEKRGFPRTAGSGKKVERPGLEREIYIAQNFRSDTIAHSDVFKTQHGNDGSLILPALEREQPFETERLGVSIQTKLARHQVSVKTV